MCPKTFVRVDTDTFWTEYVDMGLDILCIIAKIRPRRAVSVFT